MRKCSTFKNFWLDTLCVRERIRDTRYKPDEQIYLRQIKTWKLQTLFFQFLSFFLRFHKFNATWKAKARENCEGYFYKSYFNKIRTWLSEICVKVFFKMKFSNISCAVTQCTICVIFTQLREHARTRLESRLIRVNRGCCIAISNLAWKFVLKNATRRTRFALSEPAPEEGCVRELAEPRAPPTCRIGGFIMEKQCDINCGSIHARRG